MKCDFHHTRAGHHAFDLPARSEVLHPDRGAQRGVVHGAALGPHYYGAGLGDQRYDIAPMDDSLLSEDASLRSP